MLLASDTPARGGRPCSCWPCGDRRAASARVSPLLATPRQSAAWPSTRLARHSTWSAAVGGSASTSALRLYHFSSFILLAVAGFALLVALYSLAVHGQTGLHKQPVLRLLADLASMVNGAVLADNLIVAAVLLGRPAADAVRHDRHRPARRVQDGHQGVHHRRRHRPVHDGRHRA